MIDDRSLFHISMRTYMSTHTHTRILECCHQELSLGSEQLVGAATASSRDVNEDRIDSSSL